MSITDTPDWMNLGTQVVTLYNTSTTFYVPAAGSLPVDNANGDAITFVGSYQSYEIWFKTAISYMATKPFLTVTLHWYADPSGVFEMYRETWTTPCEDTGAGISTIGQGPCRSAYLSITLLNEDPAQQVIVYDFFLTATARPCPMLQPDFRNYPLDLTVPQYLVPSAGGNVDGILGIFSGTLAASSSTKLLCGLYNGSIEIAYNISGTSPDLIATPYAYVSQSGLQPIAPFLGFTSILSASQQVSAPRGPIVIELTNNSAANSVNYAISVIASTQF